MHSKGLLNRLSKKQKALLDRATGGELVKKGQVEKVKSNLEEISREREFWKWTPIPNDNSRMWGSLSDEAESDFNEVYRYLNSIEVDEEIRRKHVSEIADTEYKDLQKCIYRIMCFEDETVDETRNWVAGLEHNLITYLGVNFGFTHEEVSKFIKRNLDFNKNELYEAEYKREKSKDIMERLFG
ncbi:hypothetical protein ACN077_03260 [Clostridium chromiireducens]|uniref:hypothetical protein n=1 Tax=Clostridium chromiireducens TaxID=225345 RepID=UPI003AF55734